MPSNAHGREELRAELIEFRAEVIQFELDSRVVVALSGELELATAPILGRVSKIPHCMAPLMSRSTWLSFSMESDAERAWPVFVLGSAVADGGAPPVPIASADGALTTVPVAQSPDRRATVGPVYQRGGQRSWSATSSSASPTPCPSSTPRGRRGRPTWPRARRVLVRRTSTSSRARAPSPRFRSVIARLTVCPQIAVTLGRQGLPVRRHRMNHARERSYRAESGRNGSATREDKTVPVQ
jgi:hypothetical protein